MSGHEEVISVFPDRVLELHTTRSWDFLNSESGLRSERLTKRASNDVIIGIIDTGTPYIFFITSLCTFIIVFFSGNVPV